MRELIETIETIGKLELENGYVEDKVKCTFKDDFYSTKTKEGEFEINGFTVEFENNFKPGTKFVFNDVNGRKLSGKIWGFSLQSELNIRKDLLWFQLDERLQKLIHGEINKVKISYRMPYVNLFSRDIRPSFGFSNEFLHKFNTEPFRLAFENYNLTFEEDISLIKYKEPDFIFNRNIYPTIEFNKADGEEIVYSINKLEEYIDVIMVLISFLLFHRINSFGYRVDFYDMNGNGAGIIEYKNFGKGVCDDYLDDSYKQNLKFSEFFTENNLNTLFKNFIEKDSTKKEQLRRILYSFITIGEIEIFQPMFLSAFFLLEAISKLIVEPTKPESSENLIRLAVKLSDLQSDVVNFREIQNGKLDWLITEYRNCLTHFNNDLNFDLDIMYEEYKKILILSRSLILNYIEPTLKDFPFPKTSFK